MSEMYVKLSLLMFFEFAIWGAWCPVLAARLLGPLKMSGKQTGWIYAALPLASMISPPIAGYFADNVVDARWLLLGCHLIGAVLLFMAAKIEKFGPLFFVMLLYSLLFGASLPLVNTVMFRNLGDIDVTKIFIWAPVAWAAIGYVLTFSRNMKSKEGDGSDCLKLAALMSVIMIVVCAIQPQTVPQVSESTVALSDSFKDMSLVMFIVLSAAIAGMMQFYFLGTAQFMQDKGISSKYVPGAMALAQVTQAVATLLLLGLFFFSVPGPKWTLVIGAASWLVLFGVYTFLPKSVMIILAQPFHGFAYVFFIIAGQMFINEAVDPSLVASGQALIMWATNGIGLFLGTQLAGIVMDKNSVDGKFNWRGVFIVPFAIVLVGGILLIFGVQDPTKAKAAEPAESSVTIEEVVGEGDGQKLEALSNRIEAVEAKAEAKPAETAPAAEGEAKQ